MLWTVSSTQAVELTPDAFAILIYKKGCHVRRIPAPCGWPRCTPIEIRVQHLCVIHSHSATLYTAVTDLAENTKKDLSAPKCPDHDIDHPVEIYLMFVIYLIWSIQCVKGCCRDASNTFATFHTSENKRINIALARWISVTIVSCARWWKAIKKMQHRMVLADW